MDVFRNKNLREERAGDMLIFYTGQSNKEQAKHNGQRAKKPHRVAARQRRP